MRQTFVFTGAFQIFQNAFPELPIGEIHRFVLTQEGLVNIRRHLCQSCLKQGWEVMNGEVRKDQIAFHCAALTYSVWFQRAEEAHELRCEIVGLRELPKDLAEKLGA